jgi:cytochrome P450
MQDGFKSAGAGREDPLSGQDLTDPSIVDNPYPLFAELQEESPVAWNQQLNGWIVSRFDDVDLVLRSPHTSVEKLQPFVQNSSSSARGDIEVLGEVLSDWMVFVDPPRHASLRQALKDAFMPAEIRALAPRVRATTDELLDQLPLDKDVDVVEHFAGPLPAMVIGDLFGLPRSELPILKSWSDPLGKFVLASTDRENLYENAGRVVRDMKARFLALMNEYRETPADNFMTRMLANAGDLSDDEIANTLVLVLWAGHDTTTNHLATMFHYLCAQPDLFQRLRAEPALIPGAVEEFLRLDGPAHMLVRLVKEDIDIGGRTIRAGERIFTMMNTANRDQRKFTCPHDVQPDRAKNRHLAFGKGIHVCLGAPLARLEGVQALTALTERYSDIRFGSDQATWRQNLIMRGPNYLPVQLTANPS